MIDGNRTITWFQALVAIFAHEEQPLNALDAAIGDGDHGTTILRGMRAAAASVEASTETAPGPLLQAAAASFQKATGGAGGTVFAQIFKGLGNAAGAAAALGPESIGAGLIIASEAVQKLGRARIGSKTMLDALDPAARAMLASGSLPAAVGAARAGAESTRAMQATIGRARNVPQGGRGHLDPGACSMVLILEELDRLHRSSGEHAQAPGAMP